MAKHDAAKHVRKKAYAHSITKAIARGEDTRWNKGAVKKTKRAVHKARRQETMIAIRIIELDE